MFKISPINDKKLQKNYASACGAEFRPDYFAYAMTDVESGDLMAIAQFEIDGEYGYISDIRSRIGYSDFEAMFILGRSTMNFIDLCGAHICRAASDAGEERLLRAIGFKKKETNEYECNMQGMFDGKCDGHAVQLDK